MLNIFLIIKKKSKTTLLFRCRAPPPPPFTQPPYIITLMRLYIYKIRSVRSFVTAYLKNRSEDFSETWYEVGGQKYKNHYTAAFLIKSHVFSKTAHLCENKPFLAIFGSFWDFVKKPFREYFLNFAKMC